MEKVRLEKRIAELALQSSEPGYFPGLYAAYWKLDPPTHAYKEFVAGRVEPALALPQSRPKAVPFSNHAIVFSGFVHVDKPGMYTFKLSADDRVRLWIDGKALMAQREYSATVSIDLYEGNHALKLEFQQWEGGLALTANWIPPGDSEQPIPAAAFSHAEWEISDYKKEPK